jgi:hypothetical protein
VEWQKKKRYFLKSASRSGMKLSGRLKPLIHYPVFTPTGENIKD